MKDVVRDKMEKATVEVTDKFLKHQVGISCFFILHQPEIPQKVLDRYKK